MTFPATAATRALIACTLLSTAVSLTGVARADPKVIDRETRNETIVRSAFDHWANRTGSVFDILASDVVWTIRGSGPVAGIYNGKERFLRDASAPLISRLATPIVPEVHDVWADDDKVIVRFDGVATTNSGATYENEFVWIFRMEDDLVVEAEAFLDLTAYQTVVDDNEPRTGE